MTLDAEPRVGEPVSRRRSRFAGVALLGPAFVAAIAYVDPGNVAANVTAGARYGFLWCGCWWSRARWPW